MALAALILDAEGVFAVVAGTAGLAFFHATHADLDFARLIFEQLGVAVGTFVHAEVEFVGEFGFAAVILEGDVARLQTLMAFAAVTV